MLLKRWMIIPFALAAFLFLWWRLGGQVPPLINTCKPDVPVDAGLLTAPPTDIANVEDVIPLGNLNPGGGHVLPVDHMYLDYPTTATDGGMHYSVQTMAAGKLFMLLRQQKSGRTEYELYIRHTCHVYSYVDHLQSLSARIQHYLDASSVTWINLTSDTNGPALLFLGQSGGPAQLSLATGETLGETQNYTHNWDVGLVDTRQINGSFVNTAHYTHMDMASSGPLSGIDLSIYDLGNKSLNAACFIDYMSSGMRDTWRAKLASADKSCGRVGWDAAGHLRGSWFNPALDTTTTMDMNANEVAAFTLVPDNRHPATTLRVAMGNASSGSTTSASLAALDPYNWPPDHLRVTQIQEAFAVTLDTRPGTVVNPDPAAIGPGVTVCYDLEYGGGSYNTLFLHMLDATHLKIQYDPTAHTAPQCSATVGHFPSVAGSGWVEYIR